MGNFTHSSRLLVFHEENFYLSLRSFHESLQIADTRFIKRNAGPADGTVSC